MQDNLSQNYQPDKLNQTGTDRADFKFVRRKGEETSKNLSDGSSGRTVRDTDVGDETNKTLVPEVSCVHPEYLVFTWVMCLVALATTLKLYFIIKTLLALLMVTFYALLVIMVYPKIFNDNYENRSELVYVLYY